MTPTVTMVEQAMWAPHKAQHGSNIYLTTRGQQCAVHGKLLFLSFYHCVIYWVIFWLWLWLKDQDAVMSVDMLADKRPQEPPAGTSPDLSEPTNVLFTESSEAPSDKPPLRIRPVCFSVLPAKPMDKGKSFSWVQVHLAAVSECHVGFSDIPAGQHLFVSLCERGPSPIASTQLEPWGLMEFI